MPVFLGNWEESYGDMEMKRRGDYVCHAGGNIFIKLTTDGATYPSIGELTKI